MPSLTTLAASNDGQFLSPEAIHVVDRHTELQARGGPVPVCGVLFDQESYSGSPNGDIRYTQGNLLSIAWYLKAIQKQQMPYERENPYRGHHSNVSRPISASLRRKSSARASPNSSAKT